VTNQSHRASTVLLSLLVAACLAPDARAADSEPRRTPPTMSFAPREVVIVADETALRATAAGAPRAPDARLAGALSSLGLGRAARLGPTRRPGSATRAHAWLLHSERPGFDPVAAARTLQATGAVRAASPNYRFGLSATVPDDLFLIYQWYVDDSGFADIRLPQAWDLAQGDSSVVIAILDTGVDTTHPDLASKIWHNPGEIPGNAVDDDGNGLVDDVVGWDFGSADNDPNPEHTTDPSGIDVGFHGTFCAGIAAAATNNVEGIAGAGWKCRIMPVKISHPDSGITSEAIAAGMLYAVDQGASVISMSFGGHGDPGVPEFFQALAEVATGAGSLCVAAAGNDGDSTRVYPAASDQVLSVGATDFNNARASFSNWGPWVDIAAPGSYLWSTIAGNYELLLSDQLLYILIFGWDGVNPYMYGDGTSFACPLVAGVAGLVRAQFPGLTPHLVRQHLVAAGDAVAFDLPIGPKLNAFTAVSGGPTAVSVSEATPRRAGVRVAPNPARGPATIRFDLPQAGPVRLSVFNAAGRLVRRLESGVRPAGSHVAVWDGYDDRGAPLPAGIYFAALDTPGGATSSKIVRLDR